MQVVVNSIWYLFIQLWVMTQICWHKLCLCCIQAVSLLHGQAPKDLKAKAQKGARWSCVRSVATATYFYLFEVNQCGQWLDVFRKPCSMLKCCYESMNVKWICLKCWNDAELLMPFFRINMFRFLSAIFQNESECSVLFFGVQYYFVQLHICLLEFCSAC